MILRRCRRHVTGYSESWTVSTNIATRLQMHGTLLHPGRKRERKTAVSPLRKTGHLSAWLRADPNQGSRPVTSRRLSPSPSKRSRRFGPWDLKVKALRDTVPFTREQSSDNYPHSQLTLSPGQLETPMKWTSQDPPSSPFLIGQWCAGVDALDRLWGFCWTVMWKEFPWMSFGTLEFIWRLGRAVLREERGVRRSGRPETKVTVSMRRKKFTLRSFSRPGGWRYETQRSD